MFGSVRISRIVFVLVGVAASITLLTQLVHAQDQQVTVGSPPAPFSQNKQNEPALAVDAHATNVLVAGANDEIDMEACNAGDDTTCPFTPGVGTSGIYFSLNGGQTWIQPTYTGWTARSCLGAVGSDPGCTPRVGPIGTLPNYYENGLYSDGDPGLAFGPRPGTNGTFSWANGSRLYYSNLTANFSSQRANETFKGSEAIAVSRTDNVQAAAAGDASAWFAPVIVTKQNATTFSDKSQIWADNASSSPFFGYVYVCASSFRSLGGFPAPLVVATSTDGGDRWTTKQITNASSNPFNPVQGFGRSGCTIRTDSKGVVYVFATQFAVGSPGPGSQIVVKSFDGGHTWTRPLNIGSAVDTCFLVQFDGDSFRCVMDGIAGARDDLSSAPSVDIANGAPTGADATDLIVRTWVDGGAGVNHEHVMFSSSSDGGVTWTTPHPVESAGDRGLYSAVSISPNGQDAYLVYNAFTTPLRNDTTSSRVLQGVVIRAPASSNGVGSFAQVHRGAPGDPRASSQNNLFLEFLGDYVYAVATRTYGAAVWNDLRNGADCPSIDTWRAAAQASPSSPPTPPAPQQDCPANFGNSDIYSIVQLKP
jgi:hypothetical protein